MHTILIGSDGAAVSLKRTLIAFLEDKGIKVEDFGCFEETDQTVYPVIATKVCEDIIRNGFTKRAILLCGTGMGMCISANKFKGIRACVCHDNFSAERSILSNNCNVLCMGERIIGHNLAMKIVGEWIDLEFVDGSSTPKIQAITEIEKKNFK